MNSLNTSAVLLALGLSATSYDSAAANLADLESHAPMAEDFSGLDGNGDGVLTWPEASKDPLFTKEHFSAADTDHDGTLSEDEYSKYKSAQQQKVVKHVIDDSVITTKAKAEILATKGLKSLQISVETHKGIVILSGFVDNEAAKAKAEEVVSRIEGVRSVSNSLVVKS